MAADDNLVLGVRPHPVQVMSALSAADELTAGASTFRADFGAHGPGAEDLATNLTRAWNWRTERAASKAWGRYVAYENKQAWSTILGQLERFRPAFQHALLSDPSVEARYPNLAKLLDGRRTTGLKAAATRKKRAAKAAKAKGTK